MKNQKIKKLKALAQTIKKERGRGKKIVAVSGSFDIIHAGHAKLLQRAKMEGNILIVLLNSDLSMKAYKGPKRPIMSEDDRAYLIASFTSVDYVTFFDELNPKRILALLKPDVVCNGSDWGKDCIERSTVEAYGGKIKIIKLSPGRSASSFMKKIMDAELNPDPAAVFLDRDGTINKDIPKGVSRKENFVFLPGAIEALRLFSQKGYLLFIVSNQSGISRGFYTREDVQTLHRWMLSVLERKGIKITSVYYCPHVDEDGCECRKPAPGMILQGAKKYGVNLSKSWMIGDKDKDVMAGREVNMNTVKLGRRVDKTFRLSPTFYAETLLKAAKNIARR